MPSEGIVITKRGKPVAKLIPFSADSASLIGALAGKVEIKGDIMATSVAWRPRDRRHEPRPPGAAGHA